MFARSTHPTRAPAAEAARSLLVTATTVALHLDTVPGLVTVGGHAADPRGRLLVPTSPDCRVLARVLGAGPQPARAVVTDVAPLPVRSRVRARLRLSGRLSALPPSNAGDAWAQATGGQELAAGRQVLLLTPDTVQLDADVDDEVAVEPTDYAASRPDPLARHEAEMLSHLASGHAEQTAQLAALLPRRLLVGARRVVPLRLDRHALVLRVERADGANTDVALALASARAEHAGEVLVALRALLDTACRPAHRR